MAEGYGNVMKIEVLDKLNFWSLGFRLTDIIIQRAAAVVNKTQSFQSTVKVCC